MFNNIGGKIKSFATILTVIGIALSVIIGFVIMFGYPSIETFLIGLVVIAIGSLMSWLSSFLLYGFGQLIENSDIIAKNFRTTNNTSNNINNLSYKGNADRQWRCSHCGNMISSDLCPYCGTAFKSGIQEIESISVCASCGYNGIYKIYCPICGSSSKEISYFNESSICTVCGEENTNVQPVMIYKKGGQAYFECVCDKCFNECKSNRNTIKNLIDITQANHKSALEKNKKSSIEKLF